MTLENDFNTLISEMESNLQSMGVSDAEFDPSTGLRGLTARILDIEPSIGGLDLDTAVNIAASESTIIVGQSVVLTSKLTASYDDDTIVDVDLTGVLTGATIQFKEGSTIIGTGITDNTGVATATISNLTVGTHTIKAVFPGTENFNDCESTSITVYVNNPAPASITLSCDKPIMMKDETATITATVLDANNNPCVGETVSFEVVDGEDLGTATTDSSGQASVSYLGNGVGDLNIKAECNLLIQTCAVSDRLIYDTTEYSRTGNGSATSVATNNKTWDNTINWELTAEIKVTGMGCRIDVVPPSQSLNYHLGIGRNTYEQGSPVATYVGKNGGGEVSENHTTMEHNVYHTVKIVKEGTTVKFYFNGTLLRTDTTYAQAWIGNYDTESVKFTTWRTNTIYMRNLSVKPL